MINLTNSHAHHGPYYKEYMSACEFVNKEHNYQARKTHPNYSTVVWFAQLLAEQIEFASQETACQAPSHQLVRINGAVFLPRYYGKNNR
jgi:hypothetical protein